MKRFIRELRRREVFRTAGLYVGICWIAIEVASVILPSFGVPDWILRGAIVAAVAGFPVMLVLAWFFDVRDEGITLQGSSPEATGTVAETPGAGKKDFAIIGVLVLALTVSLALNFTKRDPAAGNDEPAPDMISALVTGFDVPDDEPLLDGVVETALIVDLETSPTIAVWRRGGSPAGVATSDGVARDAASARDIAERAGVDLLVAGSVQASGAGYRLRVEVIDVETGATRAESVETATAPERLSDAVAAVAADVADALGAETRTVPSDAAATRFATASLAAAHAYASGQRSETAGDLEQAAAFYAQAIAEDPESGRAHAGLALVQFTLGHDEAAAGHWAEALSLMDSMTEREQLRALARYAALADGDVGTANKAYAELVAMFPADADGRAGLASSSFRLLDFATAIDETRDLLDLFPGDERARTNLALYAMYQGDWQTAADAATKVIAADPANADAYLPMAMAALARGDVDAARAAYRDMASATGTGQVASAAALGLADIELYFGAFDAARQRLEPAVTGDTDSADVRMSALKSVALAQTFAALGVFPEATAAASRAAALSDDTGVQVLAALIHLQAGDAEPARVIASNLADRPGPQARAYGLMLTGMILELEGDRTKAILALRDAIDTADLWLIRLQIGKAYLRAGNLPEALDELTTLKVRSGEATALFFDGAPTYRVLSELPYWVGRVQEALDTQAAARKSYAEFIALRPQGGLLADDAAARAAALD